MTYFIGHVFYRIFCYLNPTSSMLESLHPYFRSILFSAHAFVYFQMWWDANPILKFFGHLKGGGGLFRTRTGWLVLLRVPVIKGTARRELVSSILEWFGESAWSFSLLWVWWTFRFSESCFGLCLEESSGLELHSVLRLGFDTLVLESEVWSWDSVVF